MDLPGQLPILDYVGARDGIDHLLDRLESRDVDGQKGPCNHEVRQEEHRPHQVKPDLSDPLPHCIDLLVYVDDPPLLMVAG